MDKIARINEELEKAGLHGLLLGSEYARNYVTDASISEGAMVISPKGSIYITDSRYIEVAQRDIKCAEVVMSGGGRGENAIIREFVEKNGIQRLGFEDEVVTVAAYNGLKKALGMELEPASYIVKQLRFVKEPHELEKMRMAQKITDEVLAEALTLIREGMTEKELAAEIIYGFYKRGADGLSFDPIVVSGPNSSLPHGVPTDRKLQAGDFITMDIGCRYHGYCSDMTRTVALGYATEEMEKVYNTVLEAQLAGIAAAKAGVPGCEIDGAARKVIADAGYGEYFGHGFGHSLGVEIHEAPNANPSNKEPMPCGAVVSAEPGIYLPGKFGVRIEDVIIIGENGCEDITKSPKQLIIVNN